MAQIRQPLRFFRMFVLERQEFAESLVAHCEASGHPFVRREPSELSPFCGRQFENSGGICLEFFTLPIDVADLAQAITKGGASASSCTLVPSDPPALVMRRSGKPTNLRAPHLDFLPVLDLLPTSNPPEPLTVSSGDRGIRSVTPGRGERSEVGGG